MAKKNISYQYYTSSLDWAAAEGKVDTLTTLIHANTDVNFKDSSNRTPLHKAAENGHHEVVRILIQAGADVHLKLWDGTTPLHLVAANGNVDMIDTLIQAGADVNATKQDGSTPLHLATKNGHLNAVKTLIEAGVDCKIKDGVGNRTPLHWAAENGDVDIVKTLILAGANVNVTVKDGSTPLHRAAENGHIDVIKTLVYADADVNAKDSTGKTVKELTDTMTQKVIEDTLGSVPKEIRMLGLRAVYKYVSAVENDSAVSNIIRVMIVGHYGVGKTTIAMQLLERKVNHIDTTDGIEIYISQCMYDKGGDKWHVEEKYSDTLLGFDEVIRLDIVDFAGQLIFYTTHQTYLTSRGLYLLVFNLAMGLDREVIDEDHHLGQSKLCVIDFLQFWISTIETYARSEHEAFPKIILIGTHRDKIKDESDLSLIKTEILRKFRNLITSSQLILRDDLFISATSMDDETRGSIRGIILEEGMKYKEFGERIPASWISLQEKLMKLKEERRYIVPMVDVRQINRELDTPLDEEELDVFLKYLHNIGYILYFNTSELKDNIILDPKLVIDAMRSFITCKRFIRGMLMRKVWKHMRESGEVTKLHILKMWKEKGLTEHTDHLLSIMKRLDLICEPMIYRSGQKLSLDFFVVPSMIIAAMPENSILQDPMDTQVVLVFSSEKLLPPAIFNRLVCSCLALWSVFSKHLYNGLVVLKSGRYHLMEMKRQMNSITITLAHIEVTKHPDIQLCIAIKQFLTETINQIIDVYSTSLDGPISCDSSSLDARLDDRRIVSGRYEDTEPHVCRCDEYVHCALDDVVLMRIAQKLQRVDLHQICIALLADAEFSNEIEINYMSFNADVKAFYVLQEWKQQKRNSTVTELRNLFEMHMENVNKHIICQAFEEDVSTPDSMESTILFAKVYPEFLNAVADKISYRFLHLGLELGFPLTEIERLRMENRKIINIARAILGKWYDAHKDGATVLNLAKAFTRCGVRNLKWMESEYDVAKIIQRNDAGQSGSTRAKCNIL